MNEKDLRNAKTATKLIFLVCGLGVASWAPMVPYAKDRLGLHEGQLGVLLLFLGFGALVMMPVSGIFINLSGSRIVIMVSGLFIALTLPLLLIITSVPLMAFCLLVFGAAIGSIDVAMNAHGVQVQNVYGRPIMSSLHGLFSVGGLAGSLGLGFLVSLGLGPVYAATGISMLLILICITQYRHLLDAAHERKIIERYNHFKDPGTGTRPFAWFSGSVLFLGILCFSAFLAEGAMLDWSAVFLRDVKGIASEFSGAGYAAFSVAMATMRLLGDRLVERFNNKTVVAGGSLIAASGLVISIVSPWMPLVLFGFILLGIGAANIVPIFFSDAGRLNNIPSTVSLPAVTTLGYAGQLAGPALLGFIAHHYSLSAAFVCVAAIMAFICVFYLAKSASQPFNR
ncbi:MFS transporter [Pedobacter sp. JY14-1]|uniref:MFS transporter n=1 Tax=Pedobacter sp. JY14-1 TaxID=3034151 RepID=UPI0023E313E6|nr:MFS transporter [Pedobacter sp. JY14-1]